VTSLDWPRALGWRLRQHLLDPIGDASAVDVVRRLGAIKAEPDTGAELAIRIRQQRSSGHEISSAIDEGRIIRSFAFRGAVHLMTADDAGVYLALRASSRMWELPSWQTHYGLAPADWPDFRAAVRDALAAGPLTRKDLGSVITAQSRYRQLGFAFEDKSWTLMKALFWQGDVTFGPPQAGRSTFRRLDQNPHWTGIPEVDVAGRRAVEAYFRTYGPATQAHLQYWLGEGLGAGRKRIAAWFADLRERLTEVDLDGEPAYVLADDVDGLTSVEHAAAVRLLPGHDQWVLGPGTADPHVVPPPRRSVITRGDNLVVVGGVVSGTWRLGGDVISVDWFTEAGPIPRDTVAEEVARLAAIHDRHLEWRVPPS
jgi:hypothetical protein